MTENILNNDPRFHAIEENYKRITENIALSAQKSGRTADDIHFMAVTKTVAPEYINHALSLGVKLIGENKVQEFLMKKDDLNLDGVEKHLIGHLQSNKVKKIIPHVDMIESVDSVNIAREIGKQSAAMGIVTDVLIEVNVGGEESKTGMPFELFSEGIYEIAEIPGIKIKGLMAVPPVCEDKTRLCGYFEQMRKLYVDFKSKNIDNISMEILSLGMSADYPEAIECGSNLVRVGSALFGMRSYR